MRYKAIVSYDGSNYAGWQIQNNAPSIQQAITDALQDLTGAKIKIHGSGRTDGKVHALGQCFHFDCDKENINFKAALNAVLPADIHIVECEKCGFEFHARYDAKWKHYDYIINNGEYNPLLRNYTYFVRHKLDVDLMRKAANVFIGTKDFTSFNATKKEEISDQVRTIYKIEITEENGLIKISYYGDGFLRYMVRMLSGTIVDAGLGKTDCLAIGKLLDSKDKQLYHYNCQPQGLYLVEVGYTDFNTSVL